MHRIAELVIQDYILDLKEPRCNWKKSCFEQLSYSRWAANEVLKYVKKHRNRPTIDVLKEFIAKMDIYATFNEDTTITFLIAKDVASDILDIFLAME